jgi:hypothetical protein
MPPSHWLLPTDATDDADPTGRALLALNLDVGVFLSALEQDEELRLRLALEKQHGF